MGSLFSQEEWELWETVTGSWPEKPNAMQGSFNLEVSQRFYEYGSSEGSDENQ